MNQLSLYTSRPDTAETRIWLWTHRVKPYLIDQNGCLVWTRGRLNRGGYGFLNVKLGDKQRGLLTHRIALEVKIGRLLERQEQALHSCDNPSCCNPEHLRVGSNRDNLDDIWRRSRREGGLTPDLVKQIRAMYVPYAVGAQRIAKALGVSRSAVVAVLQGLSWRHVK